jgi:YVTN family beta-propeller protein
LFDAFSSRVFAFNGRSKSVSVIDPKTRQVSEIPLAGKPEFAASDHSGRVYVNIEDLSQVAVIDATMVAVVKMLNLAPCQEPTGLSMDVAARRLFVGCGNKKMVVLDPDANRVVAEFDVGKGVDATAFDARRKLVFVSAGEGSLAVIRENSPDDFKLAQVVSTMKGGRTMAVDEQSGRVYVVSAEFLPPPPKPLPRPPHPAMTPGTFQILEFSDRSGN